MSNANTDGVRTMSYTAAVQALTEADNALRAAAEAYTKAPKDKATVTTLRDAAEAFGIGRRNARAAKRRETDNVDPLDGPTPAKR